jgi:hypothetical protein
MSTIRDLRLAARALQDQTARFHRLIQARDPRAEEVRDTVIITQKILIQTALDLDL